MAAMTGGNWGDQSSHKETSTQQGECKLHYEIVSFFCESCSDYFCQKCAHGKYYKDHVVMHINEAADKYRCRLTKIAQEIGMVGNALDQISDMLEEAKRNCNREANNIKGKIGETANSLIDTIRKRENELYREVDQKKAVAIKQIQETETSKYELSLSTDNMKGIYTQLMDDLAKDNFKNKEVVERLSGRFAILHGEVSQLEMVRHAGDIDLCFEPESRNTAIAIGYLLEGGMGNQLHVSDSERGASKNDSLVKLYTMECGRIGLKALPEATCYYDYQGCYLLTVSSMIELFVEPHTGDYAYFVWNKRGIPSQFLKVDIRRTSKCLNVLPTASYGGSNFLVYNDNTIMKLEFNEPASLTLPSTTPNTGMKLNASVTLRNAMNKVSAVCWDELMKNCYALLQDGETIKSIQFDSDTPDKFYARLNEKVNCAGMCGFYVTGFGMTIIDLSKNAVRYYATVSSTEATRVVKAPQKIEGAIPVCVTSCKRNRKWYVVWQYKVRQTGPCVISGTQTHSSIYEYSMSMENEYLLLETQTEISTLGIIDGNYIWVQTFRLGISSLVSVYSIQSTS